MKIKVCGMRAPHNIAEILSLKPDWMGFIFYPKSKRFVQEIPEMPASEVKKIGVFVDHPQTELFAIASNNELDGLQLHGDETPEYVQQIRDGFKGILIKAISVDEHTDFGILQKYEPYVDYFLFDTKGAEKGGNGVRFDWNTLMNYTLQKPIILSGGIGLEDAAELKEFIHTSALPIEVIDVNSRFEDAPGLKNFNKLNEFIQ